MNLLTVIKKNIYGIIAATVIFLFALYTLLDTFVIVRTYSAVVTTGADVSEDAGIESDTEAAKSEAYVTSNSYSDSDVQVVISEYRYLDTTVYVADISVSSPDLLATAFANNAYGKNVKDETSSIASDNGAIIAINGDFYGSRNKGYVIRGGVLYRSASAGNEDLVIWNDGTFGIINEDEISAEELAEQGAKEVFSFGPALVVNGELRVDEDDEVGRAMASNPRTAIAVTGDGHYLFIVSDGRTDESEGLDLYELAEFAKDLGADICYNLDGGGSSTMYFMGEVINNPTSNGKNGSERSVSDIVYVGK